jgi:tetratricopeptide (TPR) repeat protein
MGMICRSDSLFAFMGIFLCVVLLASCASNKPASNAGLLAETLIKADQHYKNGRMDSAQVLYKKAIELDEYQPSTYYKLGNIAVKQNKLLEAQQMYIKCIQLKPNYIQAHYNLSIVYLALAKPHIDYFDANANKNQIDPRLSEISTMIEPYSENLP